MLYIIFNYVYSNKKTPPKRCFPLCKLSVRRVRHEDRVHHARHESHDHREDHALYDLRAPHVPHVCRVHSRDLHAPHDRSHARVHDPCRVDADGGACTCPHPHFAQAFPRDAAARPHPRCPSRRIRA